MVKSSEILELIGVQAELRPLHVCAEEDPCPKNCCIRFVKPLPEKILKSIYFIRINYAKYEDICRWSSSLKTFQTDPSMDGGRPYRPDAIILINQTDFDILSIY